MDSKYDNTKCNFSILQRATNGKIAELEYTINPAGYNSKDMGFMLGDVFGLLTNRGIKFDNVVNILKIRVDPDFRGQGFARDITEMAIDSFDNPGTIIVLRSAPLMDDYPEEPNETTHNKELMNQASFLEYFGFRNINSLCHFESSVPYVYVSKNSKEFLDAIHEIEIVGEKFPEES